MSRRYLRLVVALLTTLALLCPAALAEELNQPEPQVGEQTVILGEDESTDVEVPEEQEDTISDSVDALGTMMLFASANDGYDGYGLFDHHELTIGVGEKVELYPAIGGALPLYNSDNPKIAKVEDDGTLIGKRTGSCTITAFRDGELDECLVTVKKAPSSIKLNYKSVELSYDPVSDVGESFALDYTLSSKSASNVITLSNYDADVIRIDDDYTVTAVGKGSTEIKVSTFNRKSATVKIKVFALPEAFEFNAGQLTMPAGTTYQLKPVMPADTRGDVTYYSNDESVAVVDQKGQVTAVAPGTATITGMLVNGVYATCEVEVTPAPTWITLEPEEIKLGVGDTFQPTIDSDVTTLDSGVSFKSKNKKYASVSSDGTIKAVKKGKTVTITAETYNGLTAECAVTVVAAPSKVTLNATTLTLDLYDSYALEATLTKNTAATLTWTSSDEDVVTVDSEGNIIGLNSGKARITVKTHNKKTAYCDVTVVAPPDEITMPKKLTVFLGKSTPLGLEITDEQGRPYQGTVEYDFFPAGIAALSGGNIIGKKVGTTALVVHADGLEPAFCDITVVRFNRPETMQIVAHRGGVGGTKIQENTLQAFLHTRSTKANAIEMDVHSTKDGYQVINHDTTFTVGGTTYKINALKLAQIRTLKPSMPTLDEALAVVADSSLNLYLELKASADGKKCVQAVKNAGLEDRTIYFGFYVDPLKAVYKADPNAILGLSMEKTVNPVSDTMLIRAENMHVQVLVVHMAQLDKTRVDYLHTLGFGVCAWTADVKDDIKSMVSCGVDYIISNYPNRVYEYR